MTRVAVGLLLLPCVSLLALEAAAQDPREPDTCRSLSSASRTRSSQCGEEQTTVESVAPEFALTLDRPVIETAACKATLGIEYLQIGTLARVSGVIENQDCAASKGEYRIEARVRDDSGETRTLDFSESWQRDDDQPVKFDSEYPIGDNVELLRVRSTGLRCECAAPPSEPAAAAVGAQEGAVAR